MNSSRFNRISRLRPHLWPIAVAVVLVLAMGATGSTANEPDAKAAGSGAEKEEKKKDDGRQSYFAGGASTRNPFWPVGWSPQEKVAAAPVRIQVGPESFRLSTIMLGDPPLAVINGRDVTVGDIIPVAVAGRVVSVRVSAIRDGFVVLDHDGKTVLVQLSRGERRMLGAEPPPAAP